MNKSSMTNLSSSKEEDGKKDAVVNQAKQAVSHVAVQARDQVSRQLDTRKDKAAEAIGTVASALRETGDKLKETGALGEMAGRAAERVERLQGYFDGKPIAEIARDVERFARREPALFLGGAFALGLIGGRFLKSSGHRLPDGNQSRPASGGETEPITWPGGATRMAGEPNGVGGGGKLGGV
jgi:hypothetical protein